MYLSTLEEALTATLNCTHAFPVIVLLAYEELGFELQLLSMAIYKALFYVISALLTSSGICHVTITLNYLDVDQYNFVGET